MSHRSYIYIPTRGRQLPTKFTSDMDFPDKSVAECDVPTTKKYFFR